MPPTVTVGFGLGVVIHTSGGRGRGSLWVLGQPRLQSKFQVNQRDSVSKNKTKQAKNPPNLKKDGLPIAINLTMIISQMSPNFIKLTIEMNYHKD